MTTTTYYDAVSDDRHETAKNLLRISAMIIAATTAVTQVLNLWWGFHLTIPGANWDIPVSWLSVIWLAAALVAAVALRAKHFVITAMSLFLLIGVLPGVITYLFY